jgi:hypothetical protein
MSSSRFLQTFAPGLRLLTALIILTNYVTGLAAGVNPIPFRSTIPGAPYGSGEIARLDNPFSAPFLKTNLATSHPRLIYNQQILAQLRSRIASDAVVSNIYQAVRLEAQAMLDLPVTARVKTGNAMLNVSRGLLRRINMLGVVYLVEGDKKMLDRINRELLAISAFSDWNPAVYLDTAEISMAVALALDWTHGDLPLATVVKAKKGARRKGHQSQLEQPRRKHPQRLVGQSLQQLESGL